jgi:hypothetical protein
MQMPEETSSQIKNRRAAKALAETAKLPPQTAVEVRRGVKLRRNKGGIPVWRFHYSAHPERDPDLHPEWVQEERRKYTSQADWDREQEIIDEAGGGELVFADTLVTYRNKIVITDPLWRPDPEWCVLGGFDHGKTNATVLLICYIDFDGTIYIAREYYQPGKEVWQHAPELKKMRDFSRMETCYADPTIFYATLQQSQKPGQASERAKSIGELYAEQGIENLTPFGGDRSDVSLSFAARLQLHWADLEHREPTVKIVCSEAMYSDTPQFGLHQWGCPNLLWELMRTRRQKLTAQQLLSRNASEAIVDKDNHARDAMKYLIMSQPEPSRKSLGRRASERVQAGMEQSKREGATDEQAATMAGLNHNKIMREEIEDDTPSTYIGGSARRRIRMMDRQLWTAWRNGRPNPRGF